MPGIVGIITKMPREWAEPQLMRMLESICHEPFYTRGTLIEESLGVYVGWTAVASSFCDNMPVQNERGDLSLVFSGEEFSAPERVGELKARGHQIGSGDASYLVHVCEEDESFPASFNGQFHALLVDRNRKVATLFNDRLGMHRTYYHESKEAFYFAVEAKAILAVRPELRSADPRGLGEMVSMGCVMENRTLFAGIYLLPGASKWLFRNGAIEQKNTYFHPSEWENQEPLEPEPYYCELRDTFARILPRYFNGEMKVGMALTGGMDTRLIMAWRNPEPNTIPCYTYGGTIRDCQDVLLARKVAKAVNQQHQIVEVGPEFLSKFAHYAERAVYLTDASIETSRTSDLFVSEKVRQIAGVKVVGTYSSEMLRRLRMFRPVDPRPGLFRPEFLPLIRQAHDTYAELIRVNPITFVAFRQSPWYHHPILSLEQTQLMVRSPFLDNEFAKVVFRAPKDERGLIDVRPRFITERSPALARIPTDRGIRLDGPTPWSRLQHAYQEFTFKAEYAYDYGMPQWVCSVDHMFAPLHLERLWLGRHKFSYYRLWFRDVLHEYVRQMLLDPLTLSRPYLNRKDVEAMVEAHLRGSRNYTIEIHMLLTLELMHRQFLSPQ